MSDPMMAAPDGRRRSAPAMLRAALAVAVALHLATPALAQDAPATVAPEPAVPATASAPAPAATTAPAATAPAADMAPAAAAETAPAAEQAAPSPDAAPSASAESAAAVPSTVDAPVPAEAPAPADAAPPSEAATAAPAAAAEPVVPPDPASLARNQLVLVTKTGLHPFTVEIADDPLERANGLMFRTDMAQDHGMLFDFGAEGPRSFWMKNTILPLDMIFVAADGTVVSIARNTVPYSLDAVNSDGDARFVLEVNAGVADAIGLAPGDRLIHRRIAR